MKVSSRTLIHCAYKTDTNIKCTDSIAGQMNAMRGGPVKKKSKKSDSDDSDEDDEEESDTDGEKNVQEDSETDTDTDTDEE